MENYKVFDTKNHKVKGYYQDEQEAKLVCHYYNQIDFINNKRIKINSADRYVVKSPVEPDIETIFLNLTNLIRTRPEEIIRYQPTGFHYY